MCICHTRMRTRSLQTILKVFQGPPPTPHLSCLLFVCLLVCFCFLFGPVFLSSVSVLFVFVFCFVSERWRGSPLLRLASALRGSRQSYSICAPAGVGSSFLSACRGACAVTSTVLASHILSTSVVFTGREKCDRNFLATHTHMY